MRATHRLGRRIRFARPADDLDAAGERDQTIFRHRFGVLNAMRQTGSAIGVALFGSLLGGAGGFIAGVRIALVIAAALALCAIIAAIVCVPRRA
jgi:hypothetical protein